MFGVSLFTKIDDVLDCVIVLLRKVRNMSAQLDTLTAQVASNTTVIQGAITLIAGLRQAIVDAGTDPVKLQALTDSLAKDDSDLATAVAANTVAATP